ncbi:MAG: hypothetical protein N2595_00890, partial [bacterium]|nr:hypothetical protein [bacterium]
MRRLIGRLTAILALTVGAGSAAVLPEVITTNAVYGSGNYVVSNTVKVLAGGGVWFMPGSTVAFVRTDGNLEVEGILRAEGVLFWGEGGKAWGQVIVHPG